jgi:CBS-domain-containing membrane protein
MPPIATAPTTSRRGAPTATVTEAMITDVKVSNARTTVRELWELFADDHVHAAVIVENGVLLTVVVRTDLAGNHHDAAAARLGSLRGRVVAADANLEQARQHLLTSGGRRLAVVAADGRFCGLLCLKRSRQGFCSDVDVRVRAGRHPHWTPCVSRADES